jgi:hypothetical protein
LWDVNDLFEYWQTYPPTHVLVAAYLMGGGRSSQKAKRVAQGNEFHELAQAALTAGGTTHQKLPEVYKNGTSFDCAPG